MKSPEQEKFSFCCFKNATKEALFEA